jgi:hyperosmotically inducible protein
MKVRNFIGVIAVAGLGLAPQSALAQATTTAGTTAAKADDSTLKSGIETRLKNSEALKADDIAVDVDKGVVTLTGTVHSQSQKAHAAALAKVAGVTSVNNKLTVDTKTTQAIDKAGDKTADAAHKTAEKTDEAAHKAAEKTDHAAHKTADKTEDAADKSASTAQKAGHKTEKGLEKVGVKVEDDTKSTTAKTGTTGTTAKTAGKDDVIDVDANINDAWITTKVKTNFLNEDALKGSDINVDSNNHVVTLKGTVPTAAGRARAVALAKSTKGVNRVIDALTIAPAK